MRGVIYSLCAFCTFIWMYSAADAQEFQSVLPQVLAIDGETGAVLYSKNEQESFAPASLAKLMTAEVVFEALENNEISLDNAFSVSEFAWRTGGAPSRTTSMFAALKSKIRVEDLLRGLTTVGANDSAIILAEGLSGTEKAFVERMNARAKELGLTDSHFVNATGLPQEGQKITARDLSLLARHLIYEHPEYFSFYSTDSIEWSKIFQRNRNPLINLGIGVDGLVFGFTQDVGYSAVVSAFQNGRRVIVVLHGAKRDRDRDNEAKRIVTWAINSFEPKLVYEKDQIVGRAKVYGGRSSEVDLAVHEPVGVLLPKHNTLPLTGRIIYNGPLTAPVENGAEVGYIEILSQKNILIEKKVYTAGYIEETGLGGKAGDALYELSFGWLRALSPMEWLKEKIHRKGK